MKRLWVILFVVPIFSQSPCNDNKLVRLVDIVQKEGQSSLSDKDFLYYINNKNKCPQLNPTLKIINTRKESNRELETQSSSISLCKNSRYLELKSKKKNSLSFDEEKELQLLRNLCFKEIENPILTDDTKISLLEKHNIDWENYISRSNQLRLERQKSRNQREMEESFSSCTLVALLALIGAAAYIDESSSTLQSDKRICQYDGNELQKTYEYKIENFKRAYKWKCLPVGRHTYWIVE